MELNQHCTHLATLRFDSFFEKEKAASREGFAGRFVKFPTHFGFCFRRFGDIFVIICMIIFTQKIMISSL